MHSSVSLEKTFKKLNSVSEGVLSPETIAVLLMMVLIKVVIQI